MTNAPLVTAVIPWQHALVKKTQQRLASRKLPGVRVGGSKRGWEITATPQQFLDLGLAQESGELSLPLVSRLRQVGFRVSGSRTVHLPGGTGVVEVQIDQSPEIVGRVLGCLEARDGADVVTVYDRAGVGHTRVLGAVKTVQASVKIKPSPRVVRTRRQAAKESALVNAIRQIWEEEAEEFTRHVAWDSEDYEAYTVQELVSGMLDEFLTDDQLKQWSNMEAEAQTEVLNAAFPEDKIQDTVNRVDRSFWGRERGASRRVFAQESSDEGSLDRQPPRIGKSGFDWSTVPDADEQYERAKRVLLDNEPESVTSAKKAPVKKKKPVGLLQKQAVETEINRFKTRLEKRKAKLAELKQESPPDPAKIKKQVALVKKTVKDLKDYRKLTRPKDWNTVEGLTKAAREFLESMGGEDQYIDWYDRHTADVEREYKDDRSWGGGPEAFYRILAALSPRNRVQINTSMAMDTYKNWKKAVEDKDTDFTFTKQTSPGSMPVHQMNLNRFLMGGEFSGKKVVPFEKNLLGDVNEVTIDMWMGLIFFGTTKPNAKQTVFGKQVVREIATNMGKTPRYVQGLLWEMIMKRWGKPATDIQIALRKALEALAEWGTTRITPPKGWKKQQREKLKLEEQQRKLEEQQQQQQSPLLKKTPKSKSAPAASRRANLALEDDPHEAALALMKVLGLSPEIETEGRVDPMDLDADEEPVLSRASRIFD